MKADGNIFPYFLCDGTIYERLTTRDYVAIQAMVGLSANPEFTKKDYDEIADIAYKQADAMIKRSGVHE